MGKDPVLATADARAAFLADEPVPAAVRPPILASWARSREHHVAPDRIDLGQENDAYRSSPLLDAARPVVEAAADLLATEPVSLILCDDNGTVLERRTGDSALQQHLDRVWLAPGFSYAERNVGTNGIGTALESRGPADVVGAEHWAEGLEDLACTAVPVRHPVTGRIVGVLNLTCWRKDAGPLLMATTAITAQQVEQRLREHVGRREAAVLEDFVTACRRSPDAVVAVSEDVLMLNDRARDLIVPGDHDRLVEVASEALAGGRRTRLVVDLPSGTSARVDCRPTWAADGTGGGVLVVRSTSGRAETGEPAPRVRARQRTPSAPPGRRHLPTVAVGSGTLWTMCRSAVERHVAAREWVVLAGEPGSGRRTLARAAHEAYAPATPFEVFAAEDFGPQWLADVARAAADPEGTLVLSDVDRLPAGAGRRLTDVLEPRRWCEETERAWVVVTVTSGPLADDVADLVERVPFTVEVPPLRHHVEDVPDLVRHALAAVAVRPGQERPTMSPEAMRVLARCRWPGNTAQLRQVVERVLARRRTGVVGVDDLPAEVFVGVRRVLTPVEALECDALGDALRSTGGSRTQAAAVLGLSRATVYRKVREYGLALP
ncbi:MAG: sigma-54-dependent Fis family transcriptional regulator [Actinobacteria bacterium]|nr:sigma-54-dependent Fis family transcriptional regulator [Actinomycetota bacterium]